MHENFLSYQCVIDIPSEHTELSDVKESNSFVQLECAASCALVCNHFNESTNTERPSVHKTGIGGMSPITGGGLNRPCSLHLLEISCTSL